MNLINNYQGKLFPYAYNILGSADDAKDVVQDVMTRHIAAPQKALENETGYLIRSVVNQSINLKKRNQKIIGDEMWLPEPVLTEFADDNINREDIISYSMLVLLEHLNPKERAVFILKEAFDYSHEEIADTLSISVDNSRKLLSRAKLGLKDTDHKVKKKPATDSFALKDYIHIIKSGNTAALEKLLSKEISVMADGGKTMNVVSKLTVGIKPAMDLLFYVYNTYQHLFTIQITEVNHEPALLFYHEGNLINCQVFELTTDKQMVKHIYSIVDPAKLKNLLPA